MVRELSLIALEPANRKGANHKVIFADFVMLGHENTEGHSQAELAETDPQTLERN